MSTTADEVLQLRKQYKRAKQNYRMACDQAKMVPVEPELSTRRVRRPRKVREQRSEKEKANDARLKALTARAREIRAADPSLKWTDAIKMASKE